MTKRKVWLQVLCLCFFYNATAQITALRCKKVKLSGSSLVLDTLSILPNSLQFLPPDSTIKIHYSLNSNSLYFSGNFNTDSVTVCYRVLPLLLSAEYFKRNPRQYDSNAIYLEKPLRNVFLEEKQQIVSTPGLNKTGSLTRGISLGNTQNLFVNSALNLQLEGQIAENLRLTAVISDQSVPYQPQGNTQQLREFDRVYVELASNKAKLLAGDIVLKQIPESHFLKYYKNVQGGQATAQWADSSGNAQTTIAAAVSKGKFYSDSVAVIEGVQGPYRLKAPTNEIFIVVLANSEKVFLDGRLLKRGFNFDYTIDYNQGEITFTNSVLVTKFSRVRVDFEYAERNYNRSVINATHVQKIGKANVYFQWYQEADNPNRPLGFQLNSSNSELLARIGDTLQKAIISGATLQAEWSEEQVYYVKIYDAATQDSIFQYVAIKPETGVPFFQVIFSDVGEGNGSYRVQNTLTNGRIYEWVGAGKGRYIPARQIVTPRKKSMTAAGVRYQISEQVQAFAEVAFSQNDLNRYSKADANDDKGAAQRAGVKWQKPAFSKYQLKLETEILGEILNKNFTPIDRFRAVEFDRDWGASTEALAPDYMISATTRVFSDTQNSLKYSFLARDKKSYIKGFQQQADLSITRKQFKINGSWFALENKQPSQNTSWQRVFFSPTWKNKNFWLNYAYSADKNKIQDKADVLLASALYFDEHRWTVQSPDSQSKFRVKMMYAWREDKQARNGILQRSSIAQTTDFMLEHNSAKSNRLAWTLTYRELDNFFFDFTQLKERTLMNRLDWSGSYARKHLRSDLVLTSSTGRELKRDFQFLKLATVGEGTHQWIDSNDDGVAQLEEFVEAQLPQDRRYIKVFVPTNEFVPAYSAKCLYKLNAEMPRRWRESSGWWKQNLSKFSLNSVVSAERKITQGTFVDRLLPFAPIPADAFMLSALQSWRNTLFFNRASPVFGAELQWQQIVQKQLLTNGFDFRQTQELKNTFRGSFSRFITWQTVALQSRREVSSDFQSLRNYTILQQEIQPELAFQPENVLRITVQTSYAQKVNTMGTEIAQVKKVGLDMKWSKYASKMLQFNVKYTHITYNSLANTPLGYEILEALLPGQNFTWTANWQQRLGNGLQLQFNYEGRRSEQQKTVHIGRMQLTALF